MGVNEGLYGRGLMLILRSLASSYYVIYLGNVILKGLAGNILKSSHLPTPSVLPFLSQNNELEIWQQQ